MLQRFRRHRWLVAIITVLVVAGLVGIEVYRRVRTKAAHAESDLLPKAEAPPDLQKLRDAFASGLDALQREDGADAVRHLSSFDFGSRAVEEYRLYHLAKAHELTKNEGATRVTLARLWRRTPRLIHASDAGMQLGRAYTEAGDLRNAGEVYASIVRRQDTPSDRAAMARLETVHARLANGDLSGALFAARNILIFNAASRQAEEAEDLVKAIGAADLTPSERLDRVEALIAGNQAQRAYDELAQLEPVAPHLKADIQLQRGLALHRLHRYEDSNKALEPLTAGAFKQAIPALRYTARNYTIIASAIDPIVIKNVKEKKRVGTIKVRVGKGKKRRTVKKPKYQTVTKQVKLVDFAKKNKKAEYDRLASERLKDLLSLEQVQGDLRLEVLNTLVVRAQAKNQDDYVQELVTTIVKMDRDADPALQHLWDKAWAAYSRGDLAGAQKLFRYIADTYTHPNVRRQSEYWYARTLERKGSKEEASAIYQKLASAPYADLYALHAVSRGAKREENRTNPLESERPDWGEIAEKQVPEELQLAYELTSLSAMRDAYHEIRRNMRRSNLRVAEALMADVHNSAGNKVLMYRSLRRAFPQLATVEQDSVPVYFLRMYYPLGYEEEINEYAKERKLDPTLVRAIILQESYYNRKARSSVGATGLMQLMPPTAKEHASKLGVAFAASRLEDPEVNVQLGTFHLRMLIDLFRGNTFLAVAAYNAGQGNVLKWRRGAPRKPIDEFLESIPFQETRNYVKRVTMLKSSYERLGVRRR